MPYASRIAIALRHPERVPKAVLRRLFPRHPRYGNTWIRLPDGSITFREEGFVAGNSPAALLARHNYEVAYIRRLLSTALRSARSLEVGCGYGRLTAVFSDFSDRHVALDVNEGAVKLAKATYPDCDYLVSSASSLPFADGRFGLITSWTVIQHVSPDRIQGVCSELVRVLAPGGSLLICEETRHPSAPSARAHTWHRAVAEYQAMFSPLSLAFSSYIDEIDRLPLGIESPGRVMLFRDADGRR